MKKFLGMLAGLTLTTTAITPTMAMLPKDQVYRQSISAESIISTFDVTGDWGKTTDANAPSWVKATNDGPYTKTFGQEVKKSSWNQKGEIGINFTINFNKIEGNYEESNKKYDLNPLSQTKLILKTQAGQPAHNKNNGWPEQTETHNILELINDGVEYRQKGREYDWPKWAHFNSTISTRWSADKTSLRLTWEAKDMFLSASKWTDGLFFRVDLVGLGTTVNQK